jgi:ABC-type transport system involved in multi-copper enzyme maturation permease subunit
VLLGKLLAVGLVVALYSLLALGAGAIGSYAAASLFDRPVDWPSASNLLEGLGVIWLVLAAWASLGVFLATLFRGTALAIGLGLVYGLAVEGLIFGFSDQSRIMDAITYVLLGRNGRELANSLGEAPQSFSSPDPVDPTQAALVLAGYVLGLLLIAAVLFRKRDVT